MQQMDWELHENLKLLSSAQRNDQQIQLLMTEEEESGWANGSAGKPDSERNGSSPGYEVWNIRCQWT